MNFAPLKLIMISSILVAVTACGGRSKPDRKDEPVPPSETAAAEAAAASGPVAPSEPVAVDPNVDVGTASANGAVVYEGADLSKVPRTQPHDVPYADTNTEYVGDVAQEVLNQKNGTEAKSVTKSIPAKKTLLADKVLGWLKNGNTRFVKRRVRADGQSAADRARLVAGQNPHAIVFTCSDSRVPPEIIFDQKLGEIFVVRTHQLEVDKAVITSLEKGASLDAPLLVVLTHEDCAADAVKTSGGITSQSSILADLENAGALKIQPAVYDLKTGVVKFE